MLTLNAQFRSSTGFSCRVPCNDLQLTFVFRRDFVNVDRPIIFASYVTWFQNDTSAFRQFVVSQIPLKINWWMLFEANLNTDG